MKDADIRPDWTPCGFCECPRWGHRGGTGSCASVRCNPGAIRGVADPTRSRCSAFTKKEGAPDASEEESRHPRR